MARVLLRYPVTEPAKKFYMSWDDGRSRPGRMTALVRQCIKNRPTEVVEIARHISDVSYGFVGILERAHSQVKTFCRANGITITSFLSAVLIVECRSRISGGCNS